MKRTISITALTLCVMTLLGLVLAAQRMSPMSPSILIVDSRGDGYGTFTTITDALGSASAGDTIYVHGPPAYQYNESVSVTKPVTILGGGGGTGMPVINGGGGTVFNVIASGVTLLNLTTTNGTYGVYLSSTAIGANVTSNSVFNNTNGIYVDAGSSSNSIAKNSLTGNQFGMEIRGDNNVLQNNSMTNNTYNFGISNFLNNTVDTSNTVNGKPVYVWTGVDSVTVPTGAGYVAIANSNNVTVESQDIASNDVGIRFINTTNSVVFNVTSSFNYDSGLSVSGSQNIRIDGVNASFNVNGYGIDVQSTHDCRIASSYISNNIVGITLISVNDSQIASSYISDNNYPYPGDGILLSTTSNNTIWENVIENNAGFGVDDRDGHHNTFFHNNFINNRQDSVDDNTTDAWNIEGPYSAFGEGNYWYLISGPLAGYDTNQDGILDSGIDVPHRIVPTNGNQADWYPLAHPWTSTILKAWDIPTIKGIQQIYSQFRGYDATVQCNHVVATLSLTNVTTEKYPDQLSFNLTAARAGYCTVIIQRAGLDGPFNLTLYDTVNNQTVKTAFDAPPIVDAENTTLFFNYVAGKYQVKILGTKVGWMPGDINGDGKIDIKDIRYVAQIFGSTPS